MVVTILFGVPLAMLDGTGRVEVSLGTGLANEPDMSANWKNVEYWL